MTKYCLFPFVLFFLGIYTTTAQYTILHNFNGTNGAWPNNYSLCLWGGKLYGTTSLGGVNGKGCIFSLDTNGNEYIDLFDFNDTNGNDPNSSLILSGKILYGVTALGGSYNAGCIFSIDTNGSEYKQLLDFNGTNGEGGQTSITLSGKLLYGTTYVGGVGGNGRIFSIDTSGNGYRDLLDSNIGGELVVSGSLLYGISSDGAYGYGSIVAIDTNGRGYRDLYNFNDTNESPQFSLTLSGNVLYGVASGCTNHEGYLFSIDTDGSRFKDIYDFIGMYIALSGPHPNCPLVVSGSHLYGMTTYGGINYEGNIFSVDTNGNGYKDMFEFNGTNGGEPFGSLIISRNSLYGATNEGGIDDSGVVFKIDTSTLASINNFTAKAGGIDIFPNPSNGIFTITLSHSELVSESQTIEIYNVLGEKVYYAMLKQVQRDYEINISSQPTGVYFYRVTDGNRTLLGNGKIIIEK